MKNLKEVLNKTISFQKEVEDLLITRSLFVDEKSDKWQDSNRGQDYLMESEFVEDLNTALLSAISDLEIACSK